MTAEKTPAAATPAKKVPDLTPPVKGTTAKATTAAKAPATPKPPKEPKPPKAEGESAGAGAPRPRKHEYGIKEDAQVVVKPEGAEAAKRAGVAKAYEHAQPKEGGVAVTVTEFYARGGDRHDLRVMSRRGLISIVWPTGETFPQAAVPKPLEQPKASDAASPAAAQTAIPAAEVGAAEAPKT